MFWLILDSRLATVIDSGMTDLARWKNRVWVGGRCRDTGTGWGAAGKKEAVGLNRNTSREMLSYSAAAITKHISCTLYPSPPLSNLLFRKYRHSGSPNFQKDQILFSKSKYL